MKARTSYFGVLYDDLLSEQFMSYLLTTSTLLSVSVSQFDARHSDILVYNVLDVLTDLSRKSSKHHSLPAVE